MNLLSLLDELRTIARNGLTYAKDPYDQERYQRLLTLTAASYGEMLALPTEKVRAELVRELGYITPKVGADAAIFDEEGRILLHLRADDERWCLPCGWVEANESPQQAAVREVKEETGLTVRPLELVGVFTRYPNPEWGLFTMIAVCYLCQITGGDIVVSHEGLDIAYWHLDEVPVWHANHEEYARAAYACWRTRQGERR